MGSSRGSRLSDPAGLFDVQGVGRHHGIHGEHGDVMGIRYQQRILYHEVMNDPMTTHTLIVTLTVTITRDYEAVRVQRTIPLCGPVR